jgi:hypothetical protein
MHRKLAALRTFWKPVATKMMISNWVMGKSRHFGCFATDILYDRPASPSMRDAIGGLLSIGNSMGGMSTTERAKMVAQRKQKKVMYSKDAGDRMPTCFKDEEYGQ